MLRLICSLLVLLVCVAAAKAGEPLKPQPLRASSSSELPVPTFGWTGNPQCDADGNLYFHATADINASSILKVAPDGGKFDFLTLPANDSEDLALREFFVAPGGEVWFLEQGTSGTYLFKFGHDSSSAVSTKLDVPDHLVAQDFAVFPSGVSLVSGYIDNRSDNKSETHSYISLFEASGKLRRELKAGDESEFVGTVKGLHAGAAAIGPDGLVYLLRPSQILAVDESGAVVRTLKFEKPAPKFIPAQLNIAGDKISIQFYRSEGEGKPLAAEYLLLNAGTGEVLALYQPDEELGNNLLCFSISDGFTFERVKAGRLSLLRAKIP